MKTKRFCKSTVSLILAVMMLVSMFTVGIVNTTAAETDVAETGAVTYYFGFTSWATFHKVNMQASGKSNDFYSLTNCNTTVSHDIGNSVGNQTYSVYSLTVDSAYTTAYVTINNNNESYETAAISLDAGKITLISEYGSKAVFGQTTYAGAGGSSGDDSGDKIGISFLINSDTKWVSSDDAKMFIESGSDIVEMDETVDTKSGHVMWTADVAANSSYTFYRTSYFFDESNASTNAWNTWTASSRGSNTVFKATSSTGGSWAAASTVNAADPKDIENFWDDLWIDTRGEGNPEHAVKVYYTGSSFHLYVPSYVDLSNVTVYSDHEKVVIGGTEYASGTKANLTTGEHTFAFKDGSIATNKGKIKIYQTESTAAMLMTTKEELYTGTTAGLASDNAWPSGSGITADNYNGVYKDAIETKGSYYFYDEEGNIVNSDPVLKKIKGRGNSSFEASMRIYGKYAYNFNLDSKAELIEGSTASKKWCLLANNVDHTMMRNTFIYQLADDIGIKYAPETRLVDVYDNGKYLGAYVITEKVEYGKNTMMSDMKNLDDGNENANIEAYGNEDIMDDLEGHLVQAESSVTVNGQKYTYQYTKSDDTTNWPYHQPADYNTYNYLLEFELYNRYKNEASWFVSPRTGQAVVVKYPEFATKDEMEWIISEFEEAESAIYANDTTAIQNAVDVDSFAKMYLLQELAINLDSCATSYYIHNDLTSGKLVSSPVWDYDWAFGAYAGNTKYIYNGSSVTTSANMSNPEQMFVKNKALKTDTDDNTKKDNYNFQAKLVHNDYVWERCQYFWTNDMAPALYSYLIDDYSDTTDKGTIVTEWLPKFQSSVDMNNARWGAYTKNDDWGTKVTTDYTKGSGLTSSSNFKIGDCSSSGSASKNYANTVYYLNDWLVVRTNYMSSSSGGNLYDAELKEEYKVENVSFTAVQSADESKVTITPSATVTRNGVGTSAMYTIYLNGAVCATGTFEEMPTYEVQLVEGKVNEIYIKVTPVDNTSVSGTSATQRFSCNVAVAKVNVTIYFKSSASTRYIPNIKVNGNTTAIAMTEGDSIGKNASQTQTYNWFTADVELEIGKATNITFTNSYSMNATIAVTPTADGGVYYFGVDNLNSGTTVVDLTDEAEYVRNFKKSASHMVYNNVADGELATTSINGKMLKMGDSDEDGVFTVLDATNTQMALAKKTELSETGKALADFDLDGVNSITDVTLAQTYLTL